MPFPEDTTVVVIAGLTSPGIALFTAAPVRIYGHDSKKPRGRAGAFSVATGEEVSDFGIKFELYDQFDLDAWDEFARVLDEAPKDQALDIQHPTLVQRSITAILVLEVGAPLVEQPGGPNVATCKFRKFVAKPKVSIGRPKGSNSKKNQKEGIEDAQDREIRRLLAQEKALARGF